VNLPEFSQYVQPGDRILLNDGIIELLVIKIIDREVYCRVESEGMLSSRKGISLPFTSGRLKLLSKKDISDIKFGIEQKVDYIAISFVRNAADVKEVKEIILSAGAKIPVIAKIEKPEALDNFTEILAEADGIMIARGDLGVEVPFEQVPVIQKKLIKQTNKACKPVITATQMLASMVENLRPSRAEVTDVANAILDGTDAVMLSEETAIGKNPVLSVQTMSKLAKEVEKSLNRTYDLNAISEKEHPLPDLHVAENACRLAYGTNAKVIVCFTLSGSTALKVSRFRPRMPVLALTQDIRTCRQLSLSWGVLPVMINPVNSLLEVLRDAREKITANRLAEAKDRFVVTAGIPFNEKGNTNLSGTFTV
jgi:pyruvate kinase